MVFEQRGVIFPNGITGTFSSLAPPPQWFKQVIHTKSKSPLSGFSSKLGESCMCSFHSFSHLFPASFSLIRHNFSPAVSSDSCDRTCLNSRIWVSLEKRSPSLGEDNYALNNSAMWDLVCWRAVAGMEPPSPLAAWSCSLLLSYIKHSLAGQIHLQHVRSRYTVWVRKLRAVVWKELTLSTPSLVDMRRRMFCSCLLLLQKPQHSSYTPYRQAPDHLYVPQPQGDTTRRYTCSPQIW